MSATLPNLKSISDWLGAELYQTNFRPIDLLEMIKYDTELIDKDQRVVSKIKVDPRIENDTDLLTHLVLETIVNKFGVLVFCPTKARQVSLN
jgi:DNA polymerase theta